MSLRVLGIDPGSQITGYGVVQKEGTSLKHVENGSLRARRSDTFSERLREIYESLMGAIAQFQPDAVAIEEVFYAKNIASMLKLGESRGVALLAASQSRIPIFEYSAREVKQSVTGYGQASKEQVQEMVRRLLNLPEVAAEDASDGLAVAICHLNSYKMLRVNGGRSP